MANTTESLEESYSALRGESGFQFELPDNVIEDVPAPTVPDEEPGWSVFDAIAEFLAALGPLWRGLLIIAAIALVLYVLYSVGRAMVTRRGALRDEAGGSRDQTLSDVDLRPDADFANDLMRRADELAMAGDYDGAVRLILHSSFQDMQARVRDRIGVSMTGREIGEMGQMPETSRTALRRLVSQVERSAFAGVHLGEDDYQAARQSYELFAQRGTQT